MRCPNCNTEIADHLTRCWVCDSNLITLENYLNKKNKILVIIGVFGALSIYLQQTASINNDNFFLQLGSGMSLFLMTVLSSNLILDYWGYVKKYPKNPGESDSVGYSEWTKHTADLIYLYAFLSGLCIIVASVLLFMLLFSKFSIAISQITFGLIFIFTFLAFILFPTDRIVRRGVAKGKISRNMSVILLLSGLCAFMIILFIKDLSNANNFYNLIIDSIAFFLSAACWYNVTTITIENASKFTFINRLFGPDHNK